MDDLQTQLDEVELLSAMFSHEGEFDPDYDAIEEVTALVNSGATVVPVGCRRIHYAVCLPVGDVTCGGKAVNAFVNFDLSHDYPNVAPSVTVSCPLMPRDDQRLLTQKLQEYVASLPTGEPTVVTIIQWLQTELPIFGENIVGEPITDEDSLPPLPTVPGLCVRQWVWFHHVRSKAKRASIQAWADELRLGGFLKIGKPGVLCVEGPEEDVRAMVLRVGRMTWQKMVRKHTTPLQPGEGPGPEKAHFVRFEELGEQDCGLVAQWLGTVGLAADFFQVIGMDVAANQS